MDRLVPPATARRNSVHRRYKFFRRLLNFRQCDFQFALWQMLYLLISPNRVYRHAHYQKTHKNQYARDDPAFLVLLAGFLCLSSLMVAIVFGLSFGNFLALLLWIVFVDCIGTGCVIASTLWYDFQLVSCCNPFRKHAIMLPYRAQVHALFPHSFLASA
mmetsp:Transcript_12104/g.36413  ORF Transcript_12104/g.36413 Transcript_12104/m.36413 type:complete len:159 (+) Transcript_12104:95-571(+)